MQQNDRVKAEKAILVGLSADCFRPEENATDESLDELEALLETAGGICEAKVLQNRHTPDPHSFIGEGKAQEVRALLESTGATLVVFANDLSPSQIRALEELTDATVLDRSALILDIFAQRAKTAVLCIISDSTDSCQIVLHPYSHIVSAIIHPHRRDIR